MSKEIVGLLSNKLNVSDSYTQVVQLGAVNVQPYSYSADSAGGFSTQIQHNSIVPIGSLSQTLLSKNMRERYQVQVVVTAPTAPAADEVVPMLPTNSYFNNQQNGVNTGFRAFPLQSISDNVQLSINSATTTWNSRQTISGLQRLIDNKTLMGKAGEVPVRPDDQYLLFPDAVGSSHVLSVDGHNNLNYSRNGIQAISYSTAVNGANTIYTYRYNFTEDLIIPGINSLWAGEIELANVNNLSLIFTYSNLQSDFLCSAPVYTDAATPVLKTYVGTVVVTILEPFLDLLYNTVNPDIVQIPRSLVYPYESINWFAQNPIASVDLTGATAIPLISSNTLRLTSCPKYIGFWLREPIASRTSTQADACLALDNGLGCVSINYGAKNGLLSQSDRKTLWKFSRECGSNQTYESFVTNGSWTWVSPTDHFGLGPDDVFPGEGGSVNLQINARYTANGIKNALQTTTAQAVTDGTLSTSAQMEFLVVVIYDGQMIITPDMVNFSLSVLSPAEITALVSKGSIVSKEAVKMENKGAGLYSDKSVLMKAARRKGGVMSAAGLNKM
jgi:hypothetical protein